MHWIHLSDFHYETESTNQNIFVRKLLTCSKPDFIVYTGDLHNYNSKENVTDNIATSAYAETENFLNLLLKTWQLSENDIFIIPGNHDIDKKMLIPEFQKLYANADKIFSEKRNNYRGGQPEDFCYNHTHLKNRFSEYIAFMEKFFNKTDDYAGVFLRTWKNRSGEPKLNILHVNTALYSTKENSKELHVLDTLALSRLKLDQTQMMLPTIVLGHHDISRLIPSQQNELKALLDNLNVIAWLCGDAHFQNNNSIKTTSGRTIQCYTTGVSAIDSTYYSETGFIEYMQDEKNGFTIKPMFYSWNPHLHEWRPPKNLGEINFNIPEQIEYPSFIPINIRTQINHLDYSLLPGIEYDTENKNDLPEKYINEFERHKTPIDQLFDARKNSDLKYYYLYEGARTIRGGSGKTSSLLSAFVSREINESYFPVYIRLQTLYKNADSTLTQKINDGADNNLNQNLILLLDGFDEIPSTEKRQQCIAELNSWIEKRKYDDAIILTGRDTLESYFHADEISFLQQEDIEWFLNSFDRFRVMELTRRQQEKYFGTPLPDETNIIWDILDNPFFASRYHESRIKRGTGAKRWESSALNEWERNTSSQNKTGLLIGALLYEIDRVGVGEFNIVERKRFILTKLLPALAYRKLLADRTADAGIKINPESILEQNYIQKILLSLLDLYHPILDSWPEYHKKRFQNDFYSAWKPYWTPNTHNKKELSMTEYLIGPLTYDDDDNFCFSHTIYLEFFTAWHIANIVHAIISGIKISSISDAALDVACVLVEFLDHQILIQTEEILEQYWGIPFISDISLACENCLKKEKFNPEDLVLCQIIIRFLDAQATNKLSDDHKILRHHLYEVFYKNFSALEQMNTNPAFIEIYKQFYLYSITHAARGYRMGIGCKKDLNRCNIYAEIAIQKQRNLHIPKADGYLQMGLLCDAIFEQLINEPLNQQEQYFDDELWISMANSIYEFVKELNSHSHPSLPCLIKEMENKFAINIAESSCTGSDSYLEIMNLSKYAYENCIIPPSIRKARKISYIGKAFLVLAALGNSGGAFNRLGLLFNNQAEALSHYSHTAIYRYNLISPKKPLSYWLYKDNYVHGFNMYWIVYRIQRGDQPYSSLKIVEMILKGKVSIENGLDQPFSGNGIRVELLSKQTLRFLEQAIQKAKNGLVAMSNYWYGRLLLIKANMFPNKKDKYLKQACDFFRQEEREENEPIDYSRYITIDININNSIPRQTLPIKIMLAAIELLNPYLRKQAGFISPYLTICKAIIVTIENQLNNLFFVSENPKFSNERHYTTAADIIDNCKRLRETAHDILDSKLSSYLNKIQSEAETVNMKQWEISE